MKYNTPQEKKAFLK
jgi:hypothetical protein